MIDYDSKRANPLSSYTYNEITSSLSSWRDVLREELECLIYVKNSVALSGAQQSEKITQLIPKLEALCLKQIECINEFINEISTNDVVYQENTERIYTKVESIRDNYNKIIVNIQKMITTVPVLQTYIEKYKSSTLPKDKDIYTISKPDEEEGDDYYDRSERDIQSYTEKVSLREKGNYKKKVNQTKKGNQNNKDWLDKLYKDIEDLNKKNNTIDVTHGVNGNMGKKNNNNVYRESFGHNSSGQKFNGNNSTSSKNKNNKTMTHYSKSKSQYNLTTIGNNTNNSFRKNNNNSLHRVNSNLSNNTNNRYNPNNSTISKSPNNNSTNKDIIFQKFKDELKHIKSYCETLDRELKNHCLLSNEKKEFENIKKENIKLLADVGILKEDMIDVMKKYQLLTSRISQLETENEILKNQNKNLINFISSNANNNNININNTNQLRNTCLNSNNDLVFSNSIVNSSQQHQFNNINSNLDNLNKIMNEQITEMSAFNNNINNNNTSGNINDMTPSNKLSVPLGNVSNTIGNNGNATNLSALTQMNQTIISQYRATTPVKTKRYLIPKKDD